MIMIIMILTAHHLPYFSFVVYDHSANMVRKAIENDAELLKTFSGIAYIGTDDNAYSSEEEVFST